MLPLSRNKARTRKGKSALNDAPWGVPSLSINLGSLEPPRMWENSNAGSVRSPPALSMSGRL